MKHLFTFFLLLLLIDSFGQTNIIPLWNEDYRLIDRQSILQNMPGGCFLSQKPYTREQVLQIIARADSTSERNPSMTRDLQMILDNNNEWYNDSEYRTLFGEKTREEKVYTDSTKTFYTINPAGSAPSDYAYHQNESPFLKYFYKTPGNFLEYNGRDFYLKVNPILNGQVFSSNENDRSFLFNNQRGLEIRGGIDDKVFFLASILESQSAWPDYVNQRVNETKAVPGASFFKNYSSGIIKSANGYDYLTGQGILGFHLTKNITAQFGHGRNFIGDGNRSLFLSDFATDYLFLKFQTKIWRFSYQNIFAELSAKSNRDLPSDGLIPQKYAAMHHLSYDFSSKFNVGLFESVVFGRNNGFELQYLNPIILYRLVEYNLGSPDNVLVGLNFRYNLLRRISLYGQLMLEEFKFDELFGGNGWWGNKYGYQLGLKYINVAGIDHLDGQVEFNSVRPYAYSHSDSTGSYASYNQPLAHPLGSNFNEWFGSLFYTKGKWQFNLRCYYWSQGKNTDSVNYGSNVLLGNQVNRPGDYGNKMLQGQKIQTLSTGLYISYKLFNNAWIDVTYYYRNEKNKFVNTTTNTRYFGGGIRINISQRRMDF